MWKDKSVIEQWTFFSPPWWSQGKERGPSSLCYAMQQFLFEREMKRTDDADVPSCQKGSKGEINH
jgi:hypothetical protein